MGFGSKVASWVDGAIEIGDPSRARRRYANRIACDWQRKYLQDPPAPNRKKFSSGAYDGAKTTRFTDHWMPRIGDADSDTLDDLEMLRARSSDLARNDGHAAGILETEVSNVVGTGFKAEPTIDFKALKISPERAEEIGDEMQRVWRLWQPWADVSNRLDFRDMEQLVFRSILERGDVFLIRKTKTDNRRPLSFCWQVIEADRVDTPTMITRDFDLPDGHQLSAGIETDRNGEPVFYYVLKNHPGSDSFSFAFQNAREKDFERIPAFDDQGRPNVIHLFHQKRPGQTRGVPFFAPVLLYFQNLADWMDAELVAQRLAACFGLIFNKDTAGGDATVRPTGITLTDTEGRNIEDIQPGMIANTFDTGVTQVKSERPGDLFDPFFSRVIRIMCAGVGLPYELVAKDFSESNYSNMRAALLEARRFFQDASGSPLPETLSAYMGFGDGRGVRASHVGAERQEFLQPEKRLAVGKMDSERLGMD